MLFLVAILAVFSTIVLAGGTKEGGVNGLREPVARNSAAELSAATSDFLMKTDITYANAEVIHWLLKNADVFCVQRYNNMKEGPERLAQLLKPRLLEDRRYQETFYSPLKLLVNPDLARAFFGPGEDEGSQGKEKEKEKEKEKGKFRDEEPSKSVKRNDNEVKVESIDGLPRIMGGLRISERPSRGIESIHYDGIFFEAHRLSELLVKLYKADRELAMRIVEFIIKHQMDYMYSWDWLSFIYWASFKDQLSVVDMLTPHEMSPRMLYFIDCYTRSNSKELVSRYLDKKLPENELLVRCAIAKEAKVVVDGMCSDLLRKTTDENLMDILEGREDRPSRVALSRMVLRLKLKNEADVLLKAVFYKLTPCDTKFLAESTGLNPIQEAALESDVPLYLRPARYQPLKYRLKRWHTLDSPYKYVEETEIPQEQFDPTKPHFALNTYITTAAAEPTRVADYFIERAKALLESPMPKMKMEDFELMLTALGYLLADGRRLDCSNFFVNIGDDSGWDDFIEKLKERIWDNRNKLVHGHPVNLETVHERLGPIHKSISLQEFRSLVDSSYQS